MGAACECMESAPKELRHASAVDARMHPSRRQGAPGQPTLLTGGSGVSGSKPKLPIQSYGGKRQPSHPERAPSPCCTPGTAIASMADHVRGKSPGRTPFAAAWTRAEEKPDVVEDALTRLVMLKAQRSSLKCEEGDASLGFEHEASGPGRLHFHMSTSRGSTRAPSVD
eukprot:TRINITY_DN62922_c0_g1_i1.p1 TRINITY_DN62922_c0_g1~~TRINITY_DN62922_c0_g1_i1.p1  ORF type:complete len:189 (+),score=22.97 TRINITY_DN62922_c0_g1_i1:66-569(+)